MQPEDNAADTSIDQVEGSASGEKGCNEPEDDEADEDSQEDAAHRREVDLGLEGENGEPKCDCSTGAHGHHDLVNIVSSRDSAQHETLS